jgi:hypothetical protein
MAGVPPRRGEQYIFPTFLTSQADTNIFQVNPTLAAGDVEVSIDGGAFNNIAALPVISPALSDQIIVTVSAAEMTHAIGGFTTVRFHDALGAEWQNQSRELRGVESTIDQIGAAIAALIGNIITALMAIAPVARGVRSMDLQLYRGDTWTQPIARLGDISGRDKLWITCKDDKDDADSQAIFQIEETAGLVYINGAAASIPANGSITVTDAAVGNITVVLAAVETAKIEATKKFFYDVQMLDGTTVTTLRAGYLMVTSDVTKVVV